MRSEHAPRRLKLCGLPKEPNSAIVTHNIHYSMHTIRAEPYQAVDDDGLPSGEEQDRNKKKLLVSAGILIWCKTEFDVGGSIDGGSRGKRTMRLEQVRSVMGLARFCMIPLSAIPTCTCIRIPIPGQWSQLLKELLNCKSMPGSIHT